MRSGWAPEATLEPGPFQEGCAIALWSDLGSILGFILELKIDVFRCMFFDEIYDALWYRF